MIIELNSRASLIRALSVQGLVIRVLKHWQPQLQDTTRSPEKVQTNGYFFRGLDVDGKIARMWAPIPKASELAFNVDGSVTFHPNTERSWTLAFETAS
jgi:hypothetical protein